MADEPIPDVPPPPLLAPLTPGARPGDGVTPEPPTGHAPAVAARMSGSVQDTSEALALERPEELAEAFPHLLRHVLATADELQELGVDDLVFQKAALSVDAYGAGPGTQAVGVTLSLTYTRPLPELKQPEAETPDVDEPAADAEVRLAEEAGVREPAPPDDDDEQ